MKLTFIEYNRNIYIVVGIGYCSDNTNSPEFFEVVPLVDHNLIRSSFELSTLHIPFSEAIEITNKNRLLALMVLYGK
jgi:hypothetical protein